MKKLIFLLIFCGCAGQGSRPDATFTVYHIPADWIKPAVADSTIDTVTAKR